MKAKFTILILLFGLFSQLGIAQNSSDAYRYSSYDILGTARFVALGGAFGAVGGDLSTLNYNPAGLGIFQSTEITFSPGLNYTSTSSIYNGSNGLDAKTNINPGLYGLVTSFRYKEGTKGYASGWKALNYGFSVSRIKNFNNTIYIAGDTQSSSLADVWRDNANGTFPEDLNPFSTGLAWDAYILDTVPGNPSQYYSGASLGGVSQSYWEESKGYINEMSFAVSANYDNKLLLGISIGLPNLHYRRQIEYNEYALGSPEVYEFDELSYKEKLFTDGTGVNAKIGFIYVASPNIRISGAFHTPTYYGDLLDEYSSSVRSVMGDANVYSSESPIGNMTYNLVTPLRAMAGVSFIMEKKGFISLDYEYMDYGNSKLSSNSYSFTEENFDIHSDFQATHNLRIGGEWKMDYFTLRGGYNIIGSPMNAQVNEILSSAYSWGMGYRIANLYLDFAYSKRTTDSLFYIYNSNYINPASLANTTTNFIFTVGMKF